MNKKKLNKYFKKKKIVVTGHTGFKGSWLTLSLKNLGANILGISKNVPTNPRIFKLLKLKMRSIKKIRY